MENDPPRYVHVLDDDCDVIGIDQSNNDDGSSTAVKLTQWRVAWYEQIILRMCHIPHTVENSSYAARECTGALPCLLDLNYNCAQAGSIIDESKNDDDDYLSRPVYIGRNQPGGLGSYFFHQLCQSGVGNTTNTGDNDDATTPSSEVHPSWFISSGSHIVDYLRLKHSKLMNECILFAEHSHQQQQSNIYSSDIMAYETLIQDKLNYILLSLRYGNDPAWEGVYKQQYIRAALDPNNNSSSSSSLKEGHKRWRFFPLMAWYQTYSERVLALSNLIPSNYATMIKGGLMALDLFRYNDYRTAAADDTKKDDASANKTLDTTVHQHHPYSSMVSSYGGVGGGNSGSVNVYRAMEYADMYYTSLEQKMVVGEKNPTFFLGTSLPSHIDALLFSHLAEALCDVYLVLVLAKHSRLIQYFQWMYDQYFGEKYAGVNLEWVKWNNCSNALNAFNQIPEVAALQKNGGTDGCGGMTHAISLMQRLAIHCNELDEAMRDAATLRLKGGKERVVLEKQHRPIGSTLYQWLMGGEVKFWGLKRTKKKSKKDIGKNKPYDNRSGEEEEQGDSEDAKKEMWKKQMEEVKRARRHGDEVWISGVAVTFVGVLLLSYSKGKK